MALDPRTPVIVGVAQTLRRPDPEHASEPLDQMVEALELAAVDSGSGRTLLERADSVRVVAVLSWRYTDPGSLLAGRLGIEARETVVTTTGGNSPQMLLNDTAAAVRRGEEAGPRGPGESLESWLARAHGDRAKADLLGQSDDDDIYDPLGESKDTYARTAEEISGLVDRLVDLAWPAAARESAGVRL